MTMSIALINTLAVRSRIRAGPLTRAGPGPPGNLQQVVSAAKPHFVFLTLFRSNQMKHLFKPRVSGLLLTLLLFAGGTQTALAVGTQSGLTISNIATVDYQVGGVGQTQLFSSTDGLTPDGTDPTTFAVDNMVDLTVVSQDGLTIPVAPGTNDRVLEFLVTNTGNTTQGYLLSVANGALNQIPMGSVEIWIDDPVGASPGVYDLADTLYVAATNAGDLDPNGGTDDMTVFIVADTPLAAADGDVDDYDLLATTTNASTAVVTVDTVLNTAGGVEVLFVDSVGPADPDPVNPDGTHSDSGSYTVGSATLTVSKTAVVDDGLGGTFAIPGATVTYTIVVANTGGTAATSVVISDAIPVNSTYVAASITLNAVAQTDASDSPVDESDHNVTTAGAVTVDIASLAGGATATITFQVTID
jgi:uncharacterized repeat protein (TIGR01451 family)